MMQFLSATEENWAGFASVVADGNNVIEGLPVEFVDVFRAMLSNVDPDLLHHGDGFGAHEAWFCARAFNVEFRTGIMSQKSFSHLASGGIAGAEDQHSLLSHCSSGPSKLKPTKTFSYFVFSVPRLHRYGSVAGRSLWWNQTASWKSGATATYGFCGPNKGASEFVLNVWHYRIHINPARA